MSTIRATYVQHGSSAVPNITLNASGQVIVASGIVSSGTFAAPTGSAAAPGVYFVGDTNTGLYSPGADQVAISTGGSGKLFINSAGVITTDNGFTSGRLNVVNTNTVATFDRMLLLRSSNLSNAYLGLGSDSFYVASASNAPIVFCTNSDGGTSGSSIPTNERLRITSAGLVGIGTSVPAAGIHISTAGQTTAALNTAGSLNTLISDTGFAAGNGGSLVFGASGGTYRFAAIKGILTDGSNNSTGALAFSTRNATADATLTERLRITQAGRVGIGTTVPSELLTVNGTNQSILVRTTDLNGSARIKFNADDGNYAGIGLESSALVMRCSNSSTPTERVRIDSSGRLLVGTSTAHNVGGTLGNAQFSGAGTQVHFVSTSTAPSYVNLACGSNGADVTTPSSLGRLRFYGYHTNGYDLGAQIEAAVDGTPGDGDMPTRLVFSTTADGASSPTERMRIQSNGRSRLFSAVEGNESWTAQGAGTLYNIYLGGYSRTSTIAGGTVSYVVFSNGNVQNTNNSYTAISDIKLKENIIDADSQWSDIKALQVRNYNLKEGQTHKQIGLIAQEVEPISPGLVYESPDRDEDGNDLGTVTKSVNYSVLYMKAVKALQEAMERIETLEAKVAALESA